MKNQKKAVKQPMAPMSNEEWLRDRLDKLDNKLETLRTDQRDQIDRLTRELRETFVAKIEFNPEIKSITDRLERLEGRGGIIFSRATALLALAISGLSVLLTVIMHVQFR